MTICSSGLLISSSPSYFRTPCAVTEFVKPRRVVRRESIWVVRLCTRLHPYSGSGLRQFLGNYPRRRTRSPLLSFRLLGMQGHAPPPNIVPDSDHLSSSGRCCYSDSKTSLHFKLVAASLDSDIDRCDGTGSYGCTQLVYTREDAFASSNFCARLPSSPDSADYFFRLFLLVLPLFQMIYVLYQAWARLKS